MKCTNTNMPFIVTMLLLATSGIVGCSSTSLLQTSSSMMNAPATLISKVKGPAPVSKLLCLWEPAEGQGLNEKPSRGFAGQIMFFTHGRPTPIKVDGIVHIHEYAEYDSADEDPTPIHTFTFDSGAWNAHRAEGTLGHSYNVFLPYVRKDKGHVVCALRVEIETKDGRKVSSPFTSVTLASKKSNRPASAMKRDIVNRTQKSNAIDGNPEGNSEAKKQLKIESMTIQLPSNR